MNHSTRLVPAALLLVGILAACAPAGDETAATTSPSTDPIASQTGPSESTAPMSAPASSASDMPSASADSMASHDMDSMGETVTVEMANFVFVPDRVEVNVGDTVQWVNGDGTRHTVTSGSEDTADGTFDSGDIAAGDSFSFTFTDAGEFVYFCDIHPTMTGVVVVSP